MSLPSVRVTLVAVCALALSLAFSGQSAVHGVGSFTPSTGLTLSSNATSDAASIQYTLNLAAPDYNFAHPVGGDNWVESWGFVPLGTPAAAFVAPGPGNPGFIPGTHPDLGDVMGAVRSSEQIAMMLNNTQGPCNQSLVLDFPLLNATVDITDTIDPVPLASSQPVGSFGGTLFNQWSDDGSAQGAAPPWNAAWPGLTAAEQANGLPAQVDDYPSYLNAIFDPDFVSLGPDKVFGTGDDVNGPSPPVQPLARYAGAQNVVGILTTMNVLVFSPGALSNAFPPPHPSADLDDFGYTSIAVTHNPTLSPTMTTVLDTCSPRTGDTILYGESLMNPCSGNTAAPCNTPGGVSRPCNAIPGNPDSCERLLDTGLNRYQNPAAPGTYLWLSYYQSHRDSDGDGKENRLDTCPFNPDALDPRTGVGPDVDGDGIADACDLGFAGVDGDTDGWWNNQENCPQNFNPNQEESELTVPYVTAAPRGGPRADFIGDACDPNPTVANGAFETVLSVHAKCIGGVDTDSDGWCNAAAGGIPADPNDASSTATPEDYDLVFPMSIAHSGSGATPPMRQPVQVCNDGIDNDGDALVDLLDSAAGGGTCRPKGLPVHPGFPACPATGCAVDTDGDGFTDEAERHIGTDALGRCEVGAVPARSTDWPSDLQSGGIPNSTDKVTIIDITSFLAPIRYLDTSPGNPNFNPRWDLVPGPGLFANWIVVNDLTALIAGPTGYPPMFSGVRAAGGPACTTHPVYGD